MQNLFAKVGSVKNILEDFEREGLLKESEGLEIMNLNAIPIIGWIIDLFLSASMAIPFWLIWTVYGLGEKYFYFLPDIYKTPPFWECVGLFIAIPILKNILLPSLKSSNSCECNKSKD